MHFSVLCLQDCTEPVCPAGLADLHGHGGSVGRYGHTKGTSHGH